MGDAAQPGESLRRLGDDEPAALLDAAADQAPDAPVDNRPRDTIRAPTDEQVGLRIGPRCSRPPESRSAVPRIELNPAASTRASVDHDHHSDDVAESGSASSVSPRCAATQRPPPHRPNREMLQPDGLDEGRSWVCCAASARTSAPPRRGSRVRIDGRAARRALRGGTLRCTPSRVFNPPPTPSAAPGSWLEQRPDRRAAWLLVVAVRGGTVRRSGVAGEAAIEAEGQHGVGSDPVDDPAQGFSTASAAARDGRAADAHAVSEPTAFGDTEEH